MTLLKRLGLLLFGGALALSVVYMKIPDPALEDLNNYGSSRSVSDRKGIPLWIGMARDEQYCLPLSMDKMGKWLPLVAVEVEDRRYYRHRGIDFSGIIRAVFQNVREGRIVSGGSTITSQLVRLTYPRPRKWSTKFIEFLQAMKVERKISKEDILELYLNRAPFGGNIRGVRAASLAWWSKEPDKLSLSEAVTLIAMLKGPTRYRPDLHPGRIKDRRNMILSMLKNRDIISQSVMELAQEEPLPSEMSLPSSDYLFVREVLRRNPLKTTIRSSLDRTLQAVVRKTVEASIADYPETITSSVVVLDRKGTVRAYVGNGRFGRSSLWGWVDCCSSLRSPGSALKPFVYSKSFDDGLLSPSSLLADTPLDLSGQAPRNFDLKYRGPVSLWDALSSSLNVPAVRTLRLVGPNRFLQLLGRLGFSSIDRDAHFYGDSLILGGCEVTLLDLARAYSVYMDGGMRELSFLNRKTDIKERPVFSEEASYLTSLILRYSTGDDFATKTGTSYGLRDAWTVAWNRDWIVAVWVGDPVGTAHGELVGRRAASPIAVDIMRYLGGRWFQKPSGVVRRDVCSLSGLPPVSACPSVKKGWAIAGVSPTRPCNMHRWEGGSVKTIWPSDLALFERSEPDKKSKMTITSPLKGASYILSPWGDSRVPLICEGALGSLSWFVDGKFLKTVRADEGLFWSLVRGYHRISAMDDRGRTDYVDFIVR